MQQQVAGNPEIHDAPIGLGKALLDVPTFQQIVIDLLGRGRSDGGGRSVWENGAWKGGTLCLDRRSAGCQNRNSLQQGSRLTGQSSLRVQDLHPGSKTANRESLRFLIGKASQSPQMTPVSAGQIATVGARQLLAHSGGQLWVQRRVADVDPSLEMARASFEHNTRIMSMGAHALDHRPIRAIQIDENIAGVVPTGEGMDVNVAAFPISSTEKSNCGGVQQLSCRPQSFAGERPSGWAMNQSDQIQLVRHRCQLAANGLRGNKQTAVVHERNIEVKATRRTMDFQRTATCVLTVPEGSRPRNPMKMTQAIHNESRAARSGQTWISRSRLTV